MIGGYSYLNEINLSKLSVGQIIKNYKVFCELLGEEAKSGSKGKQYQMKEWERYFNFTKSGQKFIMQEIYTEPKIKLENRGGNNRIKYMEIIEKLILDLLVQSKNNGHIFLSKNKLLRELMMVNINYAECKKRIPKLSQFMGIDEQNILEFYDSAGRTLMGNLESALNNLDRQSLIQWAKVKTVVFVNTKFETNRQKEVKHQGFTVKDEYDEDVNKYDVKRDSQETKPRKATEEETQLILKVEKEAMNHLGVKDKSEVIKIGKWERFQKYVKETLLDEANIAFYYNSYEIICNKEHIFIQWKILERKEKNDCKETLNSNIADRINGNMNKRHDKAVDKVESPLGIFADIKSKRRAKEEYLKHNEQLVDTLIKSDAKSINHEVRGVDLHRFITT
jgi:hypothetical protein